jgi:hypothetical protein
VISLTEEPLTKEQLFAKLADGQKPLSIEELSEILDSTIKHDVDNKIITFFGMLLSLTEQDAINISFAAESSTGKSYIPLELAWYFPNVIEYCYVSPTAFFHDYGLFIPDPEDKRDVEDEKKRKIIVIDLHRKNLVFMDQPHDMLLQRLRPLLSHDRKQLDLKITDRNEKHGLRTKTVRILGFPSVIFCCSKFSLQDQERTRLLLLSPDTDEDKIRDGIKLKILRESNQQKFQQFMESDPKRKWLAARISSIDTYHVKNIIIEEDLQRVISERFFALHPNLIPRNQRDITRLLALIKAHALLNLWSRKHDIIEDTVFVNMEDVEVGFKIYERISRANELGLPPEVYEIYCKLKPEVLDDGISHKEFQRLYYQLFHRTLGKKRFQEVLSLLEATGLATEEPDPNDRRQLRVIFHKLNTPEGVGNTQLLKERAPINCRPIIEQVIQA